MGVIPVKTKHLLMSSLLVAMFFTPAAASQPRRHHRPAPVFHQARSSLHHLDRRRALFQTGRELPAPGGLLADYPFNGAAGTPAGASGWQAVAGGGGWGNNELEYYTPRSSNVSLDGHGNLALTARRETFGAGGVTRQFTSARIQTLGSFAAMYGRVEARIKLPAGRGLWPAFWLLGSDSQSVGWPACGEIDVMENLGHDPFTIYGSLHGPTAGGAPWGSTAAARSATSLAADYHVYGIEWSPGRIDFTLDGTVYATQTRASMRSGMRWVFDGKPFYLLLNLAVGGRWPGSPTAATPFPATMLIDWVRVYSS